MNRYWTLAIFMLVLFICVGSVNSYFLDKRKKFEAQQAKQAQLEQTIETPVEEEYLSDDEYSYEEEYVEEDEEEYVEEETVVSEPVVQTPKAKFEVPKAKRTSHCQILSGELIQIPCSNEIDIIHGSCNGSYVVTDMKDTKTDKYLGVSDGPRELHEYFEANETGEKMSWRVAKDACEAKGFRLPNATELANIMEAQKRICGIPLVDDDYWADANGMRSAVYCNKSGECSTYEPHLVKRQPQLLCRVRCVK